jgi:hypothetical protein
MPQLPKMKGRVDYVIGSAMEHYAGGYLADAEEPPANVATVALAEHCARVELLGQHAPVVQ